MLLNILIETAPAVGSSAVLGVFGAGHVLSAIWWILATAWLAVFVLWVRAIFKYNQAYRNYEQTRREYQKSHGELPENFRLCEHRLHDLHENSRMTLKLLRRLHLIVGNDSKQLGHQPGLDRNRAVVSILPHLGKDFGNSKTHSDTKPANEQSSATGAEHKPERKAE